MRRFAATLVCAAIAVPPASAGADVLASLLEPPSRPRDQANIVSEPPDAAEDPPDTPVLELGGALRFNAFIKTWEQSESVLSGRDDIAFDTFRINVDSYYRGFHMSAEYRFYAGYNMLHHGYLAYVEPDLVDVGIGVMRAPFGLLPYASHNFFFGLTYYLGLEDDYDIGIRTDYDLGAVDIQAAFFRNDEGSYSGRSIDSARYSYDVVRTDPAEVGALSGPRRNEEQNQGNLRATYTASHPFGSTEVGASGQLGGIHNADTDRSGTHLAVAGHVHGTYGPFDLQLQLVHYDYELENPPGQPTEFVVLGAYDAPYRVASEGRVLSANVAYKLELGLWLLDSLTFYNDYSWLAKHASGFEDSHQNTTGVLVHAGPVFAYLDAVVGKNHPWIGASYGRALAEGNAGDAWQARFNANIGYYF